MPKQLSLDLAQVSNVGSSSRKLQTNIGITLS